MNPSAVTLFNFDDSRQHQTYASTHSAIFPSFTTHGEIINKYVIFSGLLTKCAGGSWISKMIASSKRERDAAFIFLFIGNVNLTDFIFSPCSLSFPFSSLSHPLSPSRNEIQRYFNSKAYAAIFSQLIAANMLPNDERFREAIYFCTKREIKISKKNRTQLIQYMTQ